MEGDDIYCHVHLLSKPGDDKTSFETFLAKPLLLNRYRRTYMALEEISVPNSILASHIKAKEATKELPKIGFHCPFLTDDIVGKNKFIELFLPEGWYSANSICDTLNELLAKKLGEKFHKNICHFVFNHQSAHVEIYINGTDQKVEERSTLVLTSWIAYLLGFQAQDNGKFFIFGATSTLFPSVIHQTKAFGKLTPPLSDTFDFLFVYCDKVQVQNTGNKQLTNVIALISRENLTASKNYLTFRPMKLQYVPVLQNIDSITSIYVKIASENGIKLEVGKGGATETRISLHACSEKYLT